MSLLAIILTLLCAAAGVVAAAWLANIGFWGPVGLGAAVILIIVLIYPVLAWPGRIVTRIGSNMARADGERALAGGVAALGLLWLYALMSAWVATTFFYFLTVADQSGARLIPAFALWAFAVATLPWICCGIRAAHEALFVPLLSLQLGALVYLACTLLKMPDALSYGGFQIIMLLGFACHVGTLGPFSWAGSNPRNAPSAP